MYLFSVRGWIYSDQITVTLHLLQIGSGQYNLRWLQGSVHDTMHSTLTKKFLASEAKCQRLHKIWQGSHWKTRKVFLQLYHLLNIIFHVTRRVRYLYHTRISIHKSNPYQIKGMAYTNSERFEKHILIKIISENADISGVAMHRRKTYCILANL